MAVGDKVLTEHMNGTVERIKTMQKKWGISETATSFSNDERITADKINSLIDMLSAGKNKSGWNGTIPSKVSNEQLVREIYDDLNTTADAITAHCPCNCNHCSCNCDYCSCNCDRCYSCSSQCDKNNSSNR